MRGKKVTAFVCAAVFCMGIMAGCADKSKENSADSKAGENVMADKTEFYNAQPVDTGWEWSNVEIVGGGFVPNIIYNPTEEGLVYCRTDIGGAYKLNKENN